MVFAADFAYSGQVLSWGMDSANLKMPPHKIVYLEWDAHTDYEQARVP